MVFIYEISPFIPHPFKKKGQRRQISRKQTTYGAKPASRSRSAAGALARTAAGAVAAGAWSESLALGTAAGASAAGRCRLWQSAGLIIWYNT